MDGNALAHRGTFAHSYRYTDRHRHPYLLDVHTQADRYGRNQYAFKNTHHYSYWSYSDVYKYTNAFQYAHNDADTDTYSYTYVYRFTHFHCNSGPGMWPDQSQQHYDHQ